MRTQLKVVLQMWDDAAQKVPLFGPKDDARSQVLTDGFGECSSGKFKLASGDPPFVVPFGSVAAGSIFLLRVEGAPGANVTDTFQDTTTKMKQLRPVTDSVSAADATPVSFQLETVANVVGKAIAHPGGADPIQGFYVIVGDPSA